MHTCTYMTVSMLKASDICLSCCLQPLPHKPLAAGSSRKGASDTAVHLRSAASSTQFVASVADRNCLLAAASKCLNKQLQDVLPSGTWQLPMQNCSSTQQHTAAFLGCSLALLACMWS